MEVSIPGTDAGNTATNPLEADGGNDGTSDTEVYPYANGTVDDGESVPKDEDSLPLTLLVTLRVLPTFGIVMLFVFPTLSRRWGIFQPEVKETHPDASLGN